MFMMPVDNKMRSIDGSPNLEMNGDGQCPALVVVGVSHCNWCVLKSDERYTPLGQLSYYINCDRNGIILYSFMLESMHIALYVAVP
jgi:hypothetical protein